MKKMTNCKTCGSQIAKNAKTCPSCGAKNRKPIYKRAWFWILAIIVLFVFISSLGNKDATPDKAAGDQISTDQSSAASDTSEPDIWSEGGTYKVGTDIPAGEYLVVNTGYGCYIEVSKDSSGTFDSIISNENITKRGYINVLDGQYLEITGGKFAAVSDVAPYKPEVENTYPEGMYLVGKDISAGEYLVICNNGSGCYVETSKDSYGTFDSIIANDNTYTRTYVSVSEGQYLTVTGGDFYPAATAAPGAPNADGTYDQGVYLVGKDIPAGEYKVYANDASCYIEVAKDSLMTFDSIITNENISLGETTYITVEDGQYLKVTGGQISQ
ncbi:MAG: zinc ribbon domain-containing protein [Clostridia bacterium]|nr:zinc ribbon domain-containing protein [Clostridia bacterium]